MRAAKGLVILGAAALLIALLAGFPARLVYGWVSPQGLALEGVSGSVWRGNATAATVGGIYLTDVSWSFRPGALLGGHIGYAVQAQPVAGFLEADVAVSPGGIVTLRHTSATLPLVSLSNAVALSGIEGALNLQIERAVIEAGMPRAVDGNVTVTRLLVRPLAPTPLGDYRADLETRDGVITGTVNDLSGVLDVSGRIELHEDGRYSMVGRVAPTPEAPASVIQQLEYLGSPDADGQREFRFEGRL